jgi:hypothetical protein
MARKIIFNPPASSDKLNMHALSFGKTKMQFADLIFPSHFHASD